MDRLSRSHFLLPQEVAKLESLRFWEFPIIAVMFKVPFLWFGTVEGMRLMWHIILYTLGTVLALRSLVSLMTAQKQAYERKLKRLAKVNAGRRVAPEESEPAPQPSVATKPTAA